MPHLCTIGYEGRDLAEFVARLQDSGVTVLVDIRWTPISRKPGFSKSALRQAVENVGIRYIHLHALGSPKELRLELKGAGNYEDFFRKYRRHLAENAFALDVLLDLLPEETLCLLCFERHPYRCHRYVVAEEIYRKSEGTVRVRHL